MSVTFQNLHEAAERISGQLARLNGCDDPAIMASQGTLGLEIAAPVPEVDAVIVPIGGGGWIAGGAHARKTLKLRERPDREGFQISPT